MSVVNLAELELESDDSFPEDRRFSGQSLTERFGAKLAGVGVYELPPGHRHWPYHFELVEEEWLLVVAGEVVLRTPGGERTLRAGDVACFTAGADGAHAVRNESGEPARFAMPSSQAKIGDGAVYPDSGKFVIRTQGFQHRGQFGETVGYWEGEA
jgi:uncharacterized cupin superfamily protein